MYLYRIYVVGIDKENEEYVISTREFEYDEDVTALIRHALERIMSAPFFCVPDRIFLKKLDSDLELVGKYEFTSISIETNVRDGCRFIDGWVQRDTFTSDDESEDESDDESEDESDDDKRNNLASKYNDLVSKYNDLASKYNELASATFIISGSESDNSRKRCKLFI